MAAKVCMPAEIKSNRWADIDSDDEWTPMRTGMTRLTSAQSSRTQASCSATGNDSPASASTKTSSGSKSDSDDEAVAKERARWADISDSDSEDFPAAQADDEWTTVAKKKAKPTLAPWAKAAPKPTPAPWAKAAAKPAPWAKESVKPAPWTKPALAEAKAAPAPKPEPKVAAPKVEPKAPKPEPKAEKEKKARAGPKDTTRKVFAGVDGDAKVRGGKSCVQRILGPGGSNLRKISARAGDGALLSLRGQGVESNATEALHMLIKGSDDALPYAVAAVEALFARVQQEAAGFRAKYPARAEL